MTISVAVQTVVSSSVITIIPELSPRVALVGLDKTTCTASSFSGIKSSLTETVNVLTVSPGAKVTLVLDIAV